jgi:hypothetical protein
MGCGTKRPRVTQHQGRPESERYGHFPHASASLPQKQINEHLLMIVPVSMDSLTRYKRTQSKAS